MTTQPDPTQAERSAEWATVISQEIRRRVQLAAVIDRSESAQDLTRRTIAARAGGCELFFRDWVWTYDPRNADGLPKDLPFVLWPKQLEFLEWLQGIEDSSDDGVCDKSRDTGITWAVAGYYVWRWLTVPGWAGAIGSRKRDLLDKIGDPKTVFSKLEYIIRMLPQWLLPPGFRMKKHRHFLRIINPATSASITGEAGDNMGRGGRASMYFLDEFGLVPRAMRVQAAVADNTRSVLYVSTATDPNTLFHRLVHDGNLQHFRISWKDDPRKAPEWRDDYLRKYGAAITAKEVDIDYSGSGDDVLIPSKWVLAAVNLDLGPDVSTVAKAGLDVADAGDAETVYAPMKGPVVQPLLAWKGRNPVDSAVIVIDQATQDEVTVLRYDSIGVGAGVTGALTAREGLPFVHIGVNVGKATTMTYYDDAPDRLAKERFANLKAELWWGLRLRFWNAWLVFQGDESADPNKAISIPDDHRLISQLSTPKMQANERGLLLVESKIRLAKRGIASPDRADAVVLACADVVGGLAPRIGRLPARKKQQRRRRR